MHCLALILPFLLGDKVSEGNEFCIFRLVNMSQRVAKIQCLNISLKHKIEELYSHFKNTFPNNNWLPKLHMLGH